MKPISEWFTPEALAKNYAARLGLPLAEPDGMEVARGFAVTITAESLMYDNDDRRLDVCRETLRHTALLEPHQSLGMWWDDSPRADVFVVLYFYLVTKLRRNQYGPPQQGV